MNHRLSQNVVNTRKLKKYLLEARRTVYYIRYKEISSNGNHKANIIRYSGSYKKTHPTEDPRHSSKAIMTFAKGFD